MNLKKLSKWVLIVGGLSTAYQGIAGVNVLQSVFGSFELYIDVIIGVAAVYLAYVILTSKKK